MNTIGRVLSIVVIVICVLTIVAALVGIYGAWRINGPLTESLTELASLAEKGLEAATGALEAVDPLLSGLQQSMQQVQHNTEELTAGIKDSTPIVSVMSAIVGEDVTPKLEEAEDAFVSTHQAVRDLNSAAQAINNVPFIEIPKIVQTTQEFLGLFDGIQDKVFELDASIEALKGGVVEGAVQPIQDLAIEIETGLAQTQEETRDLGNRLTDAHHTVAKVKTRIPLVIDIISLVFTFVLLWGILAQAALIYLSWLYLRFQRLDLHRVLAEQGQTAVVQDVTTSAEEPDAPSG